LSPCLAALAFRREVEVGKACQLVGHLGSSGNLALAAAEAGLFFELIEQFRNARSYIETGLKHWARRNN